MLEHRHCVDKHVFLMHEASVTSHVWRGSQCTVDANIAVYDDVSCQFASKRRVLRIVQKYSEIERTLLTPCAKCQRRHQRALASTAALWREERISIRDNTPVNHEYELMAQIIYLPPKIAVSSPRRTTPRTRREDNQLSHHAVLISFNTRVLNYRYWRAACLWCIDFDPSRKQISFAKKAFCSLSYVTLEIREEERETKKAEFENINNFF